MNTPLIVIHIIVCISIILIVLLQVGKGAEAGAVFGGTGQVQSSRGQATFVGKLTTVLAVTFMLTSFSLTYTTSRSAKSSVIDKVSQEQVQPAAEKDTAE
jgi:preprotein translocase subunit SecG